MLLASTPACPRRSDRGWSSCCTPWIPTPIRRCARNEDSSGCSARVRSSSRPKPLTRCSAHARCRASLKPCRTKAVPLCRSRGRPWPTACRATRGCVRRRTSTCRVPRADIRPAVETVRPLGYPAPEDPAWTEGLPEMHYTFTSEERCLACSPCLMCAPPRPWSGFHGGGSRPGRAARPGHPGQEIAPDDSGRQSPAAAARVARRVGDRAPVRSLLG